MNIEKMQVSTLSTDPENARKHSERNVESIKSSLRRFGQQKPIIVDASNVVRAGNGTLEAARQLGWEEIDVCITTLQGSEATAYAIADNRTAELAEWDNDVLAATLEGLVVDDSDLLDACGYDEDELAGLFSEIEGDGESESPYTRKIEAPIYKPTGEKPSIESLVDKTKARSLVAEIRAASLPADVEAFLVDAATRHSVFNFERIAEFYCHSDEVVQNLMEKSACVIIDFDKAIENGYVALGDSLAELYSREYPADE